eukprot:TRINITY_DN4449_c0_g1_i1.p1 TRINITY_DN4449_c0_g1~~TRINITY_DN4449_c0_g1_i1.p1  ORF type:complete len:414 (+),score=109.34 TRINITY_DN4449_c0_g1_i1:60-1244(+)
MELGGGCNADSSECGEVQSGACASGDVATCGGMQLSRGEAMADRLTTYEEAEKSVQEKDEFSLSREFYDVYKAYMAMTEERPEQAELDKLASRVKAVAFFVARLRLFSDNEELDDIATTDLKFLLIPFLLAEVTAATCDMNERLNAMRQAIVFWQAFAHDCNRLKIADDSDARAIDRDPEARLDPASKREEKIARLKRCKELDEKTAYLFEKKKAAIGDEFQWGSGGAFDEEMERDLILALLRRAVATAADNIGSAQQEIPMLEIMMARGGPGAPPPKKPPAPVEKPFVMRIQDKAELMKIYKDMVFQNPHAQPTMTLAEAAEIEMQEANERQQRDAQRGLRMQAEQETRWYGGDRYGTQEEEEEDQATHKARDWDDWKDEHPWGSGNKMANIG